MQDFGGKSPVFSMSKSFSWKMMHELCVGQILMAKNYDLSLLPNRKAKKTKKNDFKSEEKCSLGEHRPITKS